mmetsp:Transcript_20644/g.40886  ORF Transcript_20644/g.40886 Transcript_20644/m.40886 type:complete len:371 (+) Transcript_20644:628-1740(+)
MVQALRDLGVGGFHIDFFILGDSDLVSETLKQAALGRAIAVLRSRKKIADSCLGIKLSPVLSQTTVVSHVNSCLEDFLCHKILLYKPVQHLGERGGGGGGGAEAAAANTPHSNLDPKVVEVYSQVGKYLAQYTSGKIPKAFKIVPSLRDWEEILHLTSPDSWTPQAMYVATRLFASNLNPKMAQRFFNLVLLPRVRLDIEKMKKLNYHLYSSVKKSLYKPAAFFRGILLPLAQDECSGREAVIMSSILAKHSIPSIHASVALLKLAQMEYSGPQVLFMRTLLNKKYSLPYRVIDGMVQYFCIFEGDSRQMPVVWHQNLLTFVQRYKTDLTPAQRGALKACLRKQTHNSITPEIRRELFSQTSATASAMEM